MKLFELRSFPLQSCLGLVGSALLALAGSVGAQSITNPSFETDTFAVPPGAISANGPITGWSTVNGAKAGLNPVGTVNTYANNGVVPDGLKVAFLQSTNVMSTTLSGLTPGSLYTLSFRVNAPNSQSPTLRVGLDNTPILDIGGILPVGAGVPYKYVSFNFTSAAPSQTLYLTNDMAGGTGTNTVLLDDFKLALANTGWSFSIWTNDASSGVDSTKTYTHAYSFNNGSTTPTINGVVFNRIAAGNPQNGYDFSTANLGSVAADGGNVLRTAGGGSAQLASQFVFGGNPAVLTFNNLVPGKEYQADIYSVGWDLKPYGRTVTWTAGDDRLTVNQDYFGNDVGIRVSYRYIAPASGFMSISNIPFSTTVGTFHTYGAANYEVNPQTTPVVGVQPVSRVSTPGSGASFFITAGGARPLTYQWYKDGSPLANQTNRILNLTNLSGADLAQYYAVVTNPSGSATSSTAGLTFDTTSIIANPSFEWDTFSAWPGYVSGNSPISGWTYNNPARVGLNPIADGTAPFASNGTIPDGKQVAFIQTSDANNVWLSTILNNLTPGQPYMLDFAVNARANDLKLHVSIDGQTAIEALVSPVNGTNAYRRVAVPFTPAGSSSTLVLTNVGTAAVDSTGLFDDFRVGPSTTKWSYTAWTGDATVGVDNTKLYTHAYRFGTFIADAVVNGITFKAAPGANPSAAGSFSTAGFGSVFTTDDANTITASGGSSAEIAKQFIYGGPVQSITLSNLSPGIEYVFTLYTVGWEAKTFGRTATFSVGNDRLTINQDNFGDNNGNRISYRYVADASGTITITYAPTDSTGASLSTIHTYGFANYAVNDTLPIIGAQPKGSFVHQGDGATMSVILSAGTQPTYYQWIVDGVSIADQTNSVLVLSNLTLIGSADYQVVVSNALGVVTSAVAKVEVGLRIPELFNTGVDDFGNVLPAEAIDPHYQLVTSADTNYPGPQAFVMRDTWPATNGVYMTNGPFSKWLSPRYDLTNVGGIGNVAGTYVFRTSFVIDTMDPAQSQVSGLWASDNDGVEIRLNGVSTGISNYSANTFNHFTAFVITNGLVAGSNTLEFVITNLPPTGPLAFRAELKGVGRPLATGLPQIVNQPQSTQAREASTATLSAVAVGSGPLSYQWYSATYEMAWPEATNRILRIDNIAYEQGGEFYLVASNPSGSVTSQLATIEVVIPPSISSDLASQSVTCGQGLTFSIVADGSAPFNYQWYFNNAPIAGANQDTLILGQASGSKAGSYYVTVGNYSGTVTSSVAVVTVMDPNPPAITLQPQSQTVAPGSNVTFGVAADSCTPATYQWFFGGTALTGQTNATLVIANAQQVNAGNYSVEVSNGTATTPSATAVLVVNRAPVAGNVGSATSKNQPVSIPVGAILAKCSDPDNNTLTVTAASATSTNGGTVVLAGGTVTYTPVNNFTGVDRFTYTVSDSFGATASALVEVYVASGQIPEHNHVAISSTGSGYTIRFAGDAGVTYKVLRSTELPGTTWTEVATVTAPLSGIIEYQDTNPPAGSAFYRMQAVQ